VEAGRLSSSIFEKGGIHESDGNFGCLRATLIEDPYDRCVFSTLYGIFQSRGSWYLDFGSS